jgi:hypothetical protein
VKLDTVAPLGQHDNETAIRRHVGRQPAADFVLVGSLGEWLFVVDKGRATYVVSFRKFEPLLWTRVDDAP